RACGHRAHREPDARPGKGLTRCWSTPCYDEPQRLPCELDYEWPGASETTGFDPAALAPSQPRNSESSGPAGREDYGAAGAGALSDSWMLWLPPKGGWTGSGSTASARRAC